MPIFSVMEVGRAPIPVMEVGHVLSFSVMEVGYTPVLTHRKISKITNKMSKASLLSNNSESNN